MQDIYPRSTRLPSILWLLWTLFIVYGTTIPFQFTTDSAFILDKLSHVTINPLISPDTGRRVSIPDTVQNVLLFLPFGVVGMLALRNRVRAAAARVALVAGFAALLGALVETLQLFTVDRTTSVSDVASDTIGAFAGALAAHALFHAARGAMRRLRAFRLTDVPSFYPMMVATIVLLIAAWEPFDFTLDVGDLVGKLRAFGHDPWQFVVVNDEGVEFIRYLLFGFVTASWLRELGVRGSALWAAIAGVVAAVGLEGSQWIVASRMPGLEDALVHAAGAVAGAALFQSTPRERSAAFWFTLLVLATWLSAALQMLSPFTVAAVRQPFVWLPFYSYYAWTSFETISHVIELMLMYFPMGFFLAVIVRRRRAVWLVAAAAAIAIAWPLEYAQGWIVGRYPDVTDIAMAVLGAWAGVWVGGPGWRSIAS